MKFYSKIALLLALPFAAACEGNEPELAEGYYISVDKTEIESDGKDAATFTITDQDGNIISTEANMENVYYQNVQTKERLERYSTNFTTISDGEYEFIGIYRGKNTENSVKVTSKNRANYEVFHRNVAIFKLTATWCPNCPDMTVALNNLDEDATAHNVVLACHNSDDISKTLGFDYAANVALKMGMTSLALPTNIYDMAEINSERNVYAIARTIRNRRIESPASCGIKVNSFAIEGNNLKVNATMKTSKGGDYDLTCAILADYGDYHNVVSLVGGENFLGYTNKTGFSLSKDGEQSRDWSFKFETLPSEEILKSLKVAVIAYRKEVNGSSSLDNIILCGFNKTVDYQYNK